MATGTRCSGRRRLPTSQRRVAYTARLGPSTDRRRPREPRAARGLDRRARGTGWRGTSGGAGPAPQGDRNPRPSARSMRRCRLHAPAAGATLASHDGGSFGGRRRCDAIASARRATASEAPRRQPAATSERPGVARNVSSASRTWAAQGRGIQPQHATEIGHGTVVDEPLAGDAEDPDRHVAVGRIGQARLLDELEHAAAEPAGHDALLEGHDQPLAAGLVEDQLPVERLCEPGVDDPDGPALVLERSRRPRAPA